MNDATLLSPIKIGNVTIPNRIVMPPMVTSLANDDGMVTPAHLNHYQQASGPGLVIVEGTSVLPDGRYSLRQLGIYTDRHIDGLARIARIIHDSGAVAGIQIHHAGASAFVKKWKKRPARVFAKILKLARQQLLVSDLDRIRTAFKVAARRAVAAGFDIIEIHGAHGYLFTQFLSPLMNWRIDRYGGSLENRRRLLLEVFREIQSEVAENALVTCRLGLADGHKWGLSVSDGLSTARQFEKEGAKILDVSNGSGTPAMAADGSRYSRRLKLAQLAKSALTIPVIGGGGVFHPEVAEQALQDGMADLIYVGRGILADPGWARKSMAGNPESIVRCRQCQPCFYHTDGSKCPARIKQQRMAT